MCSTSESISKGKCISVTRSKAHTQLHRCRVAHRSRFTGWPFAQTVLSRNFELSPATPDMHRSNVGTAGHCIVASPRSAESVRCRSYYSTRGMVRVVVPVGCVGQILPTRFRHGQQACRIDAYLIHPLPGYPPHEWAMPPVPPSSKLQCAHFIVFPLLQPRWFRVGRP